MIYQLTVSYCREFDIEEIDPVDEGNLSIREFAIRKCKDLILGVREEMEDDTYLEDFYNVCQIPGHEIYTVGNGEEDGYVYLRTASDKKALLNSLEVEQKCIWSWDGTDQGLV